MFPSPRSAADPRRPRAQSAPPELTVRTAALASLFATIALFATSAQAQRGQSDERPVANGARVRLHLSRDEARLTGREMLSGTLVSTDGQRAIVARPGAASPDTVATFTVDEFEVYDGQRSRRRMIVAGAAAGAGASLIVYAVEQSNQSRRCKRNPDPDCKRFISPAAYGAPVAVGALFGATFSSTRWRNVPRDIVSVAAGSRHSVSVSSTLHFR
jgi:hypothetical protein